VAPDERRHPKGAVPVHTESWRKPLPLTVSRNCLPPAVALLGEIDVTDGGGGQVPQDRAVTSAIASTGKTGDLAVLAMSMHDRRADRQTDHKQERRIPLVILALPSP
jgi:hypothetical protein